MVFIRACVQCVGSLPASSILWWNLVIGVLPSSQTYFWYCDRYATYTIVAPLYAQQQPNKIVDQYTIRLRHLAESCNFGVLNDEMLRDRLILGCRDRGAKARLFREKDCSLQKALEALQISEAAQKQLKGISDKGSPNPVNVVKLKKGSRYKKPNHTSLCTTVALQNSTTNLQLPNRTLPSRVSHLLLHHSTLPPCQ